MEIKNEDGFKKKKKKKLVIGGVILLLFLPVLVNMAEIMYIAISDNNVATNEEAEDITNNLDSSADNFEEVKSNDVKTQSEINELSKKVLLELMQKKYKNSAKSVEWQEYKDVSALKIIPLDGFTQDVLNDLEGNGKVWSELVEQFKKLSMELSQIVKNDGANFKLAISLQNDLNLENTLLVVSDGVIISNVAD